MNDELLDVVNEQDEVIGQKYKSAIYRDQENCFRVINAFLVNDNNQVWIPTRSASKKLFPSCLDTSVGGHVAAGESYEEAFVRELNEELNLNATTTPYQFIKKLTPSSHGVSAYMHLYIIRTNTTPNYNPLDFMHAEWVEISTAIKDIKNGKPAKGDLLILLNTLHQCYTNN